MTTLITILLILFLPGVLLAQEYPRMERLSTEQGLSQGMVYGIFQDSEGFLWFGTRDGLNRYDGYGFMTLRHDPFDTTSLPWTSVSEIAEDAQGNLWLASSGGVAMLDRRTYRFSRIEYGLAGSKVLELQKDRSGGMWVGTEHGLVRYDTRTGKITRFPVDPDDPAKLSGDSISSLYEDRTGRLWIGTNGRYLHRYNPDRGNFTRFDPGIPGGRRAHCLGEDSKGNIYTLSIGDTAIIVITGFDRASGAVVRRIVNPAERFYTDGSWMEPLCIDAADGAWIQIVVLKRANNRGPRTILYRMPLRSGAPELTFHTPGDRPIGFRIWEMLCDRSGIVWAGTENGVVKVVLDAPQFHTDKNIPGDTTSLSNDRIRGIHKDRRGTLWVGTDNGLNRLDPGSRGWKRYMFDLWPLGTVGANIVNTFFEDGDGTLFLGTNAGFGVYDRNTSTFSRGDTGRRSQTAVWSFLRDGSGMLWVGTRAEGILVYDRSLRLVRHIQPRANDSTTIAPGLVWDMHRDRYGTIWVATSAGLYKWLPGRGIFRRYATYPSDPHGLGDENVCAILEDASGVLWFSTYGGGLSRYNRGADNFTTITTRNGLPSNALYGALMDGAGKLWISSNTGLAVYDPATGSCRAYNAGDGLQSNEFSFKAFHRTKQGEMFFGGINGLTAFHPDSLHESRRAVPIVVTEFRVFDAIVRRELREQDTIAIDYQQSFISFQFAALDYINPAGIRYAYQLVGFDRDWINCGDRRYASFTNLEPGTYTFMVKGTNSDGVWNPRPLHIILKVIPPFWMTWWFKLFVVAAIILAAGIGVVLRIRSIRGKEVLRRRGVESQLQALRLQVNPHFIFNALSSIQHLILIAERERAVAYLSRFAELVRAILDNSERTSIPLADEIMNLRNYLDLEAFRFEGRLSYRIDIAPGLDIHRILIPTMLIQPCVENAIRHGLLHKPGEGTVVITMAERGALLYCSIEDDGVGRSRALELRRANGHEGRSMGIRVTEERLSILNALSLKGEQIRMEIIDLMDDREASTGTRVELFIPIEFN